MRRARREGRVMWIEEKIKGEWFIQHNHILSDVETILCDIGGLTDGKCRTITG